MPTPLNESNDCRHGSNEPVWLERSAPKRQRVWCGKLSICPNEMVPLQIDLAIGDGRYLLVRSANPGVREPAIAACRVLGSGRLIRAGSLL